LTTSFQGSTLDPNLHLDVPNPSAATATLDTVNHNLVLSGTANLWDTRGDSPFAWTDVPTEVGVGGTWRAETEVQYNNPATDLRIAGITTYSGPDGTGGANSGQQFTFGLDQWDTPNGPWVQGLVNNHPGNSANLTSALASDTVDLRMDVLVGDSNNNTYNFYYKLPTDGTWTTLGTIQDVNSDSRVALFYKGNNESASFNYFNVYAVTDAPEPGTLALIAAGTAGLLWVRRGSRRV
jgi:hypothetical protein